MNSRRLLTRAATGTFAGIAGTAALQRARALQKKFAKKTMSPMHEEPGSYMVEKAESMLPPDKRSGIPEPVEEGAVRALGIAYGAAFGALYGVAATKRRNPLVTGSVLGVATWAVGYLGWLPALKLMPPVTRHKPLQVAASIATHVYFGVVTAGAYWRFTALRKERSSLRARVRNALT